MVRSLCGTNPSINLNIKDMAEETSTDLPNEVQTQLENHFKQLLRSWNQIDAETHLRLMLMISKAAFIAGQKNGVEQLKELIQKKGEELK